MSNDRTAHVQINFDCPLDLLEDVVPITADRELGVRHETTDGESKAQGGDPDADFYRGAFDVSEPIDRDTEAFHRVTDELATASDREFEIVLADAERAAGIDAVQDNLTEAFRMLARAEAELTILRKRDIIHA